MTIRSMSFKRKEIHTRDKTFIYKPLFLQLLYFYNRNNRITAKAKVFFRASLCLWL